MSVLSRLAEGFEVQLDSVVKHVELLRREGSNYTFIRVTDTRGNEFTGDKVRCGCALCLDCSGDLSAGDSDSAFGCAEG